jgi:hypothetical protein
MSEQRGIVDETVDYWALGVTLFEVSHQPQRQRYNSVVAMIANEIDS